MHLNLTCGPHPPTSAHLKELWRQEEIWDATKGNFDICGDGKTQNTQRRKSARSRSPPASDFLELRASIATFCALLLTLFGDSCDLYWSMFEIMKILRNPFCTQNKHREEH